MLEREMNEIRIGTGASLYGIRLHRNVSDDTRNRILLKHDIAVEGRHVYYYVPIPLTATEIRVRDNAIYGRSSTEQAETQATLTLEAMNRVREHMNRRATEERDEIYRTFTANVYEQVARRHAERVDGEWLRGLSTDGVVYDESVPDQAPDPVQEIMNQCRQWSDEQLQSIRTVLVQEGKRRKHEREHGSTDTNTSRVPEQDSIESGLGQSEYVSGGPDSI